MKTNLDDIAIPAKPAPGACACQPTIVGKSIVNRTLTRIAEYPDHQGANGFAAFAARNARKMRRECSAFG
jgi:hypothetical protein